MNFMFNKENIINIAHPENTIDLPKLFNMEGFVVCDENCISSYHDNILTDKITINSINGVDVNVDKFRCDHCREHYDEYFHYYCDNCSKLMCDNCYDKLGSNNLCSQHSVKMVYTTDIIYCNICEEYIFSATMYSSSFTPRIASFGLYSTATIDDTLDVCLACKETDSGQKFIKEHDLLRSPNSLEAKYDTYEFGSIFDWVPLLVDRESNMILFNHNSDSIYRGRLAFLSGPNNVLDYNILHKSITVNNLRSFLHKISN